MRSENEERLILDILLPVTREGLIRAKGEKKEDWLTNCKEFYGKFLATCISCAMIIRFFLSCFLSFLGVGVGVLFFSGREGAERERER